MFVQLHTLTPYPATLLNRDDAGFAKTLPFGGVTRTRVSSQCLKYHWRNFDGEDAIRHVDAPETVRSRETFRRRVVQPLVDDGHPEPLARAVAFAFKEHMLSGKKAGKGDTKTLIAPDEDDDLTELLDSNQITVLGVPETRYLCKLGAQKIESAREDFPVFWENGAEPDADTVAGAAEAMRDISKSDLKKNLKALDLAAGLNAAMFGRMVTSDILARGDAAIHVAHAFTTHASEVGDDYFTAVDELRRDEPEESGELGAGHVNNQQLTSGLFYSYVVIDVPLLVSNITAAKREEWTDADRSMAAEVARRLVLVMAKVSPGAKLGSTAPYSRAHFLFAETGTTQPRTLANAFQEAVTAKPDKLANSYDALAEYLEGLNGMYAPETERHLSALHPPARLTEALDVKGTSSVEEIASWVQQQIEAA